MTERTASDLTPLQARLTGLLLTALLAGLAYDISTVYAIAIAP